MARHPPLSPTVDYVFKLIFGDRRNVNILARFLKTILDLGSDELSHLTIMDPSLKREQKWEKSGVLDIKVHTKSSVVINVEMQMRSSSQLRDRIVFYGTKMLQEQKKRGESHALNRVINIVIVNDTLLPEEREYLNRYTMMNRKSKKTFTELLEVIIMELPKVPEKDDGQAVWPWLEYLRCRTWEEYDMLKSAHPEVEDVVGVLAELSEDEIERMEADAREKFLWDQAALRDDAIARVIVNLKKLNIPVEQIAKATGYTVEKVTEITG
jgi:predicted transposase/invertase (TIGR01784 family)